MSPVQTDGFEIVKRAWLYVRQHRFLWVYGFLVALAGGGSQGFSLWVQSPIPRGLTGYSPIHQIGARITDFAHNNWLFWVLFVIAGVAVGLVVLAVGSFAQIAAIGGVAEIEAGGESGFREALGWGRDHFWRYLVLVIIYVAVLGAITVPSLLFWWSLGKGKGGFVLPCVGGLILGISFVLVSMLASVMLELSGRFLVLKGTGILESIQMAGILIKDFYKDIIVAWLYVLAVTLAGVIAMAVLIAVLSSPLSWMFTFAQRHHSGFLIALSMLAFLLAWALAAALSGLFVVTGSAVWTLAFIELETDALPVQ